MNVMVRLQKQTLLNVKILNRYQKILEKILLA